MRDSAAAKVANWIWGGGTETHQYTEFKLYWLQVREGLEEFAKGLGGTLKSTSKTLAKKFREDLNKASTAVARRHLGDDLDPALVIRTTKALAAGLKLPVFELDTRQLNKLRGTGSVLMDDEARTFLRDARLFWKHSRDRPGHKSASSQMMCPTGYRLPTAPHSSRTCANAWSNWNNRSTTPS